MQDLTWEFPGEPGTGRRAHVGVVGSGDLEILFEPDAGSSARVVLRTSVDGFDTVWRTVLERFFARHRVAGTFTVNDFGVTPGMVVLRLGQVLDRSRAHDTTGGDDD